VHLQQSRLQQVAAKSGSSRETGLSRLTGLPENWRNNLRKMLPMPTTTPKTIALEQHLIEMRSNQAVWRRRPLLRKVYGHFYELMRRALAPIPGPIVELGSGIGAVKEFMPTCITTDIFPNPWLDQQENAYSLTFADASVSNIIMLDVFHHLIYPGTALSEFHRVLRMSGRVIILEPAMSLLGRLVYGLFHHEPLGLRGPISWLAPSGVDPKETGYYAAQANASKVFLSHQFSEALSPWDIPILETFPDIAYVASGGFSKPQLYPLSLLPVIRASEKVLAHWPNVFATRLLVVLEKKPTA
jgi:Methyltransferase domain